MTSVNGGVLRAFDSCAESIVDDTEMVVKRHKKQCRKSRKRSAPKSRVLKGGNIVVFVLPTVTQEWKER